MCGWLVLGFHPLAFFLNGGKVLNMWQATEVVASLNNVCFGKFLGQLIQWIGLESASIELYAFPNLKV